MCGGQFLSRPIFSTSLTCLLIWSGESRGYTMNLPLTPPRGPLSTPCSALTRAAWPSYSRGRDPSGPSLVPRLAGPQHHKVLAVLSRDFNRPRRTAAGQRKKTSENLPGKSVYRDSCAPLPLSFFRALP
ncbi:hypothetical protein EV126DRAFT_432115 [Verticillium dahliae]|nr:hypothetical protein EV126DRAFT_432115 [Verticillium dahliae]